MHIKATLRREGHDAVDVVITADATATVADLALALFRGDPLRGGGVEPDGLTLRIGDVSPAAADTSRVLDATASVVEAGIRSGSSIELVRDPGTYRTAREARGAAAANLRVLAGPDAGREFPLPFGSSVVGRDPGADIRLSDPLISKRHVRINLADTIEMLDLNSANGTSIGDQLITRAVVMPADVVEIGDTRFCVVPLQRLGGVPETSPTIDFVRSPRVVARYEGRSFKAPKAPQPPRGQRLPWVAIAAPLVMGAVIFATTHLLIGVITAGLSPLLVIGGFIDQRVTARRELRDGRRRFAAAVEALRLEERAAQDEQRTARMQEAPSLSDVVDGVRRLGPLLWTHRPEHEGFLTARIGLGRAPSRDSLELPGDDDMLPEFRGALAAVAAELAVIDGVPHIVELRASGSLGVSGERPAADDVARSIVLQLAGLHSPAELVLAAFVSSASRPSWSWLRWLPHVSSPHSPLSGDHLADGRGAATSLLAQLEGVLEARSSDDDSGSLPAIVVVVEDDAPADRARLTRLAERGPEVGIHLIWCAASAAGIPAACRVFIGVRGPAGGPGAALVGIGRVDDGQLVDGIVAETADAATAESLARALAPVVDAGAPIADESDLPRSVAYAALAGRELLSDPTAVVERWRENGSITPRDGVAPVRSSKESNLRALVGHAGAAPFYLDLRLQGPHALVGGTTGSGKSEFLQSWVLGMALAHSPDRLTFLFVDYKGGSAFADCVELPHAVGLVTDLSAALVRRALTSLRAELHRRERLLQRKGAKDLVTLEKSGDPDAPPTLVIVVDEFAALTTDVPEFVDGVVDIAQRGRSLGLHLVLATQRPQGIIRGSLRTNTNLRIALRMADADDSTDILDSPMAAGFDPAVPGRGAARSGPARLTAFQTGYLGGWTTDAPPPARIEIRELAFGSGTEWEVPAPAASGDETGPKDITRLVTSISAAAEGAGISAPRRPWLDALAPVYDLARLPTPRTDERLLLGVQDAPSEQAQPTVFYEPDRDGNMAIYGTGGSGKSTVLRSLAISAAVTPRGGPVVVYGLDFGSSGLQMLEELPHVGSIVRGDDEERVQRMLRMLRDVVDERGARYAAANAGDIGAYRRQSGRADEARILLLVDGMGAFREAYELSGSAWFTTFAQIAADGRSVGVHVVMTADRPSAIPASVNAGVQRRLVLRLAGEDDYRTLGAPYDVLSPASPPGRGLLDGDEVQVAVLGADSNVAVQAREVAKLADSMRRQGVAPAAPVRRLPEAVALGELPEAASPGRVSIAVADETLLPIGVEPVGGFLIAGPVGSGRTTALTTLVSAVRRGVRDARLVHISARPTPLGDVGTWTLAAVGVEAAAALAGELAEQLRSGAASGAGLTVVLEGVTDFGGTLAETPINTLVREAMRAGAFVVGEGETSTWSQAYAMGQPFKAARRGLLLVPGDSDGDTFFATPLGRIRRSDYPSGRGFLIERGRASKVQVAR